ncbi:transcription factor Opi1-domain-containing protein [Apodospora peruviana]|uniref:Transcription factor Opi1-domain-containing protein n=1 Tax=Apodospora peruviana TaxID=516989 RepID=A0AAE0IHZ4_9PEZI|nr:transcription factor Opi1-domain-containing protein [Apodospora peruviana]
MQHSPPYSTPLQFSHERSGSTNSHTLPLALRQQSESLSPSSHTLSAHTLNHDPAVISFPDVPKTELPPIQLHNDKSGPAWPTLPPLSSVTGGQPPPFAPIQQQRPEPPKHWPSLNPLTAFYQPSHAKDAEMKAASPNYYDGRRSGSVSLDDPDVRMAAEALGDLRADFVSSPPNRSTPLPSTDYRSTEKTPEPLLSLITTSHPLLATTIDGATSAYNTSKNLSPHIKTGAEYVEGFLSPVAKVAGNVGRKTGMESGVRWIFGRRHKAPSDLEAGGRFKRRKVKLSEKAVEALGEPPEFLAHDKDRRTSISTVDTLPAYDDHKSPAYTEAIGGETQSGSGAGESSLPQRLIVTTSGLGVAMKDEALGSLKYCLHTLGGIVGSLTHKLNELNDMMDKYDSSTIGGRGDSAMARMNALRSEMYHALWSAINVVSKYAGTYLPENARALVESQIKSLPGRFPWRTMQEIQTEQRAGGSAADQEKMTRDQANVVVQFVKEGLNTLIQVSEVLERTIASAEEWLQMFKGMKSQNGGESSSPMNRAQSAQSYATQPPTAVASPMATVDGDVNMS